MPTPIDAGEKAAFIAIVSIVNPIEADRLATILVNYDDVVEAIRRQLDIFAANPAYLKEAISVFTPHNTDLLAAGIYNNGFDASQIVDPKVLISYAANGGILSTITDGWILLLSDSTVTTTTVSTNKNLLYFYIGPSCTVDLLDSSADGAFTNNLYLPFLKNRPAILKGLLYGSFIGNIKIEEGSVYGGITSYNPGNSCALPITSLAVGINTHNSIELTWIPPVSGGYLYINAYYKRTDSGTWIKGNDQVGDYVLDTGFMFTDLEPDTAYSFRVTTVCNNGGTASIYISAQTPCCGSGNSDSDTCPIAVTIATIPNPALTDTLCNGDVIYTEYAPAATLTILKTNGAPLLAGAKAPVEITIDNVPYQKFPFNTAPGQFDATTTPLLTFINGNIITFEAVLPS